MKRMQIPQFVYQKFCVHEIAAVNLSKIYFLKNAKKTCKPNKRYLKNFGHHGWPTTKNFRIPLAKNEMATFRIQM